MSGTDVSTKILEFLSRQIASQGAAMCVRIELLYTPPGNTFRSDSLRSWYRESQAEYFESNSARTGAFTAEVVTFCEGHADSFSNGQPHQFTLRSHQAMGGREICRFVLLPSYESSDQAQAIALSGSGSGGLMQPIAIPGQPMGAMERADTGGVVGMLMRHLENKERLTIGVIQTAMGVVSQTTAQLRGENDALRQQITDMTEARQRDTALLEEARSQEHQRQIEAMTVTSREERKSHVTKKLTGLLPVALSQWFGSRNKDKKIEHKPTPLGDTVAKLLESLTEDQQDKIEAILHMEQQAILGQIISVIQNGHDPVLLPTMLHDLASTLLPEQMQAIMGMLEYKQAELFVKAMQLAKSQAEPAQAGKAQAEGA